MEIDGVVSTPGRASGAIACLHSELHRACGENDAAGRGVGPGVERQHTKVRMGFFHCVGRGARYRTPAHRHVWFVGGSAPGNSGRGRVLDFV